jgi:hypothetical protein
MKKPYSILVFLIVVLAILGFLFRGSLGNGFSKENEFSIADTASVNRIEILSADTIILSKQGMVWSLNGDSPASSVAVNNFLFGFHRMSVKGINSKPDIAEGNAIRVKIYQGKKKHLIRFYLIDGISFMLKEGGSKLYAVEVSGFPNIKPEELIGTDPDHWRDRTLLDLQAGDIKTVSVIHSQKPENDFLIKVSDGKIQLFDVGGENEIPENLVDKEKLNFYLSYFTNVFYDSTLDTSKHPEQEPKWIIKVEDNSGKKYELVIFPLMTTGGEDFFKAIVKYNNQPDFKVTRFMVLDLLLQDKSHFLLPH